MGVRVACKPFLAIVGPESVDSAVKDLVYEFDRKNCREAAVVPDDSFFSCNRCIRDCVC